jgi:hypothetical protein
LSCVDPWTSRRICSPSFPTQAQRADGGSAPAGAPGLSYNGSMEPDLLSTDEVAKSLDKPVLVIDVTDPSIKGSMIAGAAADSLFYYPLLFALAFQLSEDERYRRRVLVAALGPRTAGTRGHLGRPRRHGNRAGRAVAGQRRPRREAPPAADDGTLGATVSIFSRFSHPRPQFARGLLR